MKLLILVGSGAVGKMTVGQSIMRKTALRLFHNHMMIEPVIEIFGEYNHSVVAKLRRTIFEEFLKTEREGLIFTYMWAFDCPEDGDYNIKVFYDLLQLDGYNPLQVKQITYSLKPETEAEVLSYVTENADVLKNLFAKPFTPGKLYAQIYNKKVGLTVEEDKFFAVVILLVYHCIKQLVQ